MKQKFKKLTFVHICKHLPKSMSHFDSDFDAIVDGTYSQIYGGDDIDSYAVYKIKGNRIVNRISWYMEEHLSLLPQQDREKAEEMIEKWNFRKIR